MNGIEKITARIDQETQAQIDQILSDAKEQAAQITAKYQAQADAERASLAAKNEKAAAEREERLVSVAQMESRKVILAAKQEMVEKAYDLALEKLCAMPEEQYVSVLAALLVEASTTGQEEAIFSPEDREKVGRAAVKRANELLAKQSAPELPKELTDSKVGAVITKVATSVSAMAQGTAMLTVSQETRPIRGGFIMVDGDIEVNCAFETLVRLQREKLEKEVAGVLFP